MSVSRVTMLWPSDLKSDLQKQVGKRGLTAYVLSAVKEKIAAEKNAPAEVKININVPSVAKVREALEKELYDPTFKTPVQKVLTCPTCGVDLDENGNCWVCG